MTVSSINRRRSSAARLADHAEQCEVRVQLSGVAIYPQQVAVKEVASVTPTGEVSPLVQLPSDYNGTWETNQDINFDLTVSGDNSETGKVKGTVSSPGFLGSPLKFKGNISNGIDLEGKFRGKLIAGPEIAKFKAEVSTHLTDLTHMTGTIRAFFKGQPPQEIPFTGNKI